MHDLFTFLKSLLGIDVTELSTSQILARCVVVFIVGIALVRISNKRFVGKMTAFDTIIAIVIGSLLSRAITAADMFLKTLAACLLLVLLHRLFSLIALYSDRFGNWIKGHDRVVVQDGKILLDALKKSNLSQHDLMQTLRLNGNTSDVSEVKTARLERNGDISVILIDEN